MESENLLVVLGLGYVGLPLALALAKRFPDVKGNSNWSGYNPDPGTSKAPYKIYNIGNNNPVELLHFINVIEECLGIKAQKNMLPLQLGDVSMTYADVDDLVADVGFKPSTSIELGVQRFIEWYKKYYIS